MERNGVSQAWARHTDAHKMVKQQHHQTNENIPIMHILRGRQRKNGTHGEVSASTQRNQGNGTRNQRKIEYN